MSDDIEKENETTRPAAPTFVYPPQDPDKTKVLAISPVNFQVQVHQEPHLRHYWRLDTQYPGADPGYPTGHSLNGMFTQRVAIQNGPAHFGARASIRAEWTEWGWIWFTVVAKPTMSPLNGASGPRPRFNGTKTNNSKAVVSLQFSTGKTVTVEGSTSTSWTYQTPVGQEMVPGNYTVTVSYVGVPNSSSTYTFTVGLTPPAITSPLNDAVIIDKLPVVAITGYPGAIATVRKSGNGEVLIGNVLLDGGGRWSGRITREIALGQHYSISVIQKFNGLESQWGPNVRLRMLAPPTITSPTQNQEVDMRITVSGTVNALFKGGTIRIKRDVAGTLLGTATVNTSTGAWQAQLSVNLIPGDYSLTAEHVFSGVTSLGASPVRLKVRPSQPQLTAPDPASGLNPVLTGTGGHTGATLVLSDATGEDLGSMTVTGNSWSVSPRSALVPGLYAFKVRQSISSMQSLWSNVRTYTVRVPNPTLTEPITVTDQKPSFSGTANTWEKQTQPAQVRVWSTDLPPVVPLANVSDNRWASTVTEPWAPGTYDITVEQLYKSMSSGFTYPWVSLVIPAPLPVITGIEREGFSPRITGTCWSGAALELKYSDRPTVDHPVSGTDGNWTFRRDLVFAPGDYSFTVTQTFGWQTSDTASGSFNIPTPTLTVTEPAANQKVGLLPVFKGTNGYAGARLTIHDAMSHAELGGLTLDSSGAWSVPIEIELAVGIRTIYVVQSFNGQLSLRSEQRTFEVIILIPTVTVPALNGRFERQGVIIGQGIAGAFVAVYLVGSSEIVAENIPVDEHGAWAAPTRLKEVGSHTLLVNQVYKNQLSDVAIHAFTLVPAPPLLESPAAGQGISGSTVASGFGFAGDTLKLFRRGGSGPSSLGSTVVTPEGTWSLAFTWGANWQQYSLSAQSSQQEQQSAHSPLRPVLTRSAAPSITEPAPMVWVGAAPTFAGTGREGATVTVASWFNRLEVLATTTVLPGGHWTTVATKNLLPGQHRVVVRQTENEVDSAEVMSDLFIVE